MYCVILSRIPSARLAACWYGDALQMRITQSISLSNIKPFRFIEKARPRAVGNLPDVPACFQIGVTIDGDDLETVNELWWS